MKLNASTPQSISCVAGSAVGERQRERERERARERERVELGGRDSEVERKVPRSRGCWFAEVSLHARAPTNGHRELDAYPNNRFVYEGSKEGSG